MKLREEYEQLFRDFHEAKKARLAAEEASLSSHQYLSDANNQVTELEAKVEEQ
jgi:hypothetical protein